MKCFWQCILGICFLVSMTLPTWAGNMDTYGIGSAATAMGGAYSAYANDPFAIYYNPAGLTTIRRPMVAAGVIAMDPNLKGKDFFVENISTNPVDFHDESSTLVVPHLGTAFPLTGKFSVGLALYAPFGNTLRWDDTADLYVNPSAYNCYQEWIDRIVISPGIAYKFNDKLSIGLAVAFGQAHSGAYLQSFDFLPLTVKEEVDMEDPLNISVNLGILYQPIKTLTLGLTYRSQTRAHFDGDLKLKGLNEEEKSLLAAQGITKFEYDVETNDIYFPDQIQAGIRYQPHPKITLEADLVWTNWSLVDNETLEFNEPLEPALQAALGGTKLVNKRDWQDTKQVKVGVEWKVNDRYTFRCGYFYDPTPIPDDTFDIIWADADKKTYSAGLGINIKKWTIDTVIQYTIVEQERTIGGESSDLNNSFGGNKVSTKATGHLWGYGITLTRYF